MCMRTIGKALVLAMALSGIAALSVAQTVQKPEFEVASIKPHLPSDRRPNAVITHSNRVLVTNHTLRQLVLLAYSPRYRANAGSVPRRRSRVGCYGAL